METMKILMVFMTTSPVLVAEHTCLPPGDPQIHWVTKYHMTQHRPVCPSVRTEAFLSNVFEEAGNTFFSSLPIVLLSYIMLKSKMRGLEKWLSNEKYLFSLN